MQLTSSNFGSPNGPGSDLDGVGTRSGSTKDEKLDASLEIGTLWNADLAESF